MRGLTRSAALLLFVAIILLVTSYYGYRTYAERQVIVAIAASLNAEFDSPPALLAKPPFISRPRQCLSTTIRIASVLEPVYESFQGANRPGTKPIPLTMLEGLVPHMSWQDNQRLAQGDYRWEPEDEGVVWLSRVGFNASMTKALGCISGPQRVRHPWKLFYYLERRDNGWEVVETIRGL